MSHRAEAVRATSRYASPRRPCSPRSCWRSPMSAVGPFSSSALLARPASFGSGRVSPARLAAVTAGRATPGARLWAAVGVVYAGLAFMSPAILRQDPLWGLTALWFLFATVWTTDIFAFLGGRAIGGPLLWPQVSPNKTWVRAIAGLAGGVAAGVVVAYASGIGR